MATTNQYRNMVQAGGDAPVGSAVAVTPADTVLPFITRALWVGTEGDIAVKMANNPDNVVVTYVGVPAGVWMPLAVTHVMAATTADDIVACT